MDSESVLFLVPYNKLVLKKKYMIITHGLAFTGTYYHMFGDILGGYKPAFIDFEPNIENKIMLICSPLDKFYVLKVKME